MLGFMTGCAFLSMWLSNTSTVAMVMPIAEAVMQQVMSAEGQVSSQQDKALKGICNPALQLDRGQLFKPFTSNPNISFFFFFFFFNILHCLIS